MSLYSFPMHSDEINTLLADAIAGRHLLEHPFYKRWEAGLLAEGELAEYAGQYRHFEAALPVVLAQVVSDLPVGPAREFVQANLDDELGAPDENGVRQSHLQLFDVFVSAVGGSTGAAATAATSKLAEGYVELTHRGPLQALAAITAYELQAPGVASSKSAGLTSLYGISDDGAAFWDVHAAMDVDHAEWAVEALAHASVDADRADIAEAARWAADAWWAFLDDREASALVGATC